MARQTTATTNPDSSKLNILWRPQPGPQTEFSTRPEFEVLYGGAKGGGKSDVLLMEGLRQINNPNYHAGFFRRTYPRLQEMIDRSWQYFPKLGAKWKGQEHRWVFPSGARYDFRHLQNEEDKYNYHGQEFHYMAFDQLEEFTDTQYDFMLMQVRTSDPTIRTYVRASANPGGTGAAWVKARFISGKEPRQTYQRLFDLPDGSQVAMDSAFIPAKVYDNKILLAANPRYLAQLMATPEPLRSAMLEGNWDIFAGQMFSEFNRDVHVVKPFKIPPWWRRWIGNDPGFSDPYSWHWFAADEDGNVYIYREFARGSEDPKISYSEQAAKVVELSRGHDEEDRPFGEQIDWVCTGMDAFNQHPETGKSIVDYYREGGLKWGCIQPIHGPRSRGQRAATMHEYMQWVQPEKTGEGGEVQAPTAKLRIFSCCTKLVEAIPSLIIDEHDPEAVAACSVDHYYDSTTYGLCAWHSLYSKPPEAEKSRIQRDKERLAKRSKRGSRRIA